MAKRALIVWGGWEGHEPKLVADRFEEILKSDGFEVVVSDSSEAYCDAALMAGIGLIVPIVTMSTISQEALRAVCSAVESGVGMAGCHGGMCDSYRSDTEWQFMTGGQWVAHPGNDGVRYTVNLKPTELTEGLADFEVVSEQYYMHVDPGARVHATTWFPTPGADGPHVQNPCDMPQVWTKMHGKGRVFYCALGHKASVFDVPEAAELMRRGFAWSCRDA